MTRNPQDDPILTARVAATAAVAILVGAHDLAVAVADPLHGRLRQSLAELMPVCRALTLSFPAVRGRVAGLVYQAVEYRGFQGSSALHIVHQIAELLLDAGERWLPCERLSAEQLEKFAAELDRALPSTLDDWLRNQLDPELAELERELGAPITDVVQGLGRPRSMARIERLIQPYLKAQGYVVLAVGHRRTRGGDEQKVAVEFASDTVAVVTEGRTRVEIRGIRLVRLFRSVVDARGRTVAWKDLVQGDMESAADRLRGNGSNSSTPRFSTDPDSFRRAGSRIRRELGKLGYHWHQDGRGARWDDGTQ